MFKMDSINVPVLGLVENMLFYSADLPQNIIFLKNMERTRENMILNFYKILLVQSVKKLLMRKAGFITRIDTYRIEF